MANKYYFIVKREYDSAYETDGLYAGTQNLGEFFAKIKKHRDYMCPRTWFYSERVDIDSFGKPDGNDMDGHIVAATTSSKGEYEYSEYFNHLIVLAESPEDAVDWANAYLLSPVLRKYKNYGGKALERALATITS